MAIRLLRHTQKLTGKSYQIRNNNNEKNKQCFCYAPHLILQQHEHWIFAAILILVLSFVIFVNFKPSKCRYFENVRTNLTRKMANFIVKPFEIDVKSMQMKTNTMNEIDWKWCSCQASEHNNISRKKKKKKPKILFKLMAFSVLRNRKI